MEPMAKEPRATARAIDLAPIRDSLRLIARSLPIFALLCLVAATGRALQVGAAGEPGGGANILLEIIVEGSRVAILLHLLGQGSITAGCAEIRRLFTKGGRQAPGPPLRDSWPRLVFNIVAFAAIAGAANLTIFAIARYSPALEMLQRAGWIAPEAGEVVIVLFLKNLSVIPWTLSFIAALVHWFSPPDLRSQGTS
jgi:hypothetical protein